MFADFLFMNTCVQKIFRFKFHMFLFGLLMCSVISFSTYAAGPCAKLIASFRMRKFADFDMTAYENAKSKQNFGFEESVSLADAEGRAGLIAALLERYDWVNRFESLLRSESVTDRWKLFRVLKKMNRPAGISEIKAAVLVGDLADSLFGNETPFIRIFNSKDKTRELFLERKIKEAFVKDDFINYLENARLLRASTLREKGSRFTRSRFGKILGTLFLNTPIFQTGIPVYLPKLSWRISAENLQKINSRLASGESLPELVHEMSAAKNLRIRAHLMYGGIRKPTLFILGVVNIFTFNRLLRSAMEEAGSQYMTAVVEKLQDASKDIAPTKTISVSEELFQKWEEDYAKTHGHAPYPASYEYQQMKKILLPGK
jgi:hypothetical protein